MKKIQRIKKTFVRKELISIIASYQLYYQISLGEFVKQSDFEKEKIESLDLDIEPENVFNTIVKIIESFSEEDSFKSILDDNIKFNAMIHALNDFVNKNDEIKQDKRFYETYNEKIENDEFYTVHMHIYFEEEIDARIKYWENLISEETALALQESALKMV